MQGLGRDLPKYAALHTQILGISYDDTATQHKFALHCAAAFPFLTDQGGVVAKAYASNGQFGPFKLPKRRTFLIDRTGLVRHVYEGMPDTARILAALKPLDAAATESHGDGAS